MDKRKLNRITMAFLVVTILVVGLMLNHTLRRSSHITLPDTLPPGGELSGEVSGDGQMTVIRITPETVQAAVATLNRPEQYRRTVKVEQSWSGGSGMFSCDVSVLNGWTRLDRVLPDQQSRHSLTDGETTYIWYGTSGKYLKLPAGGITADEEQSIPTYEEILELPTESIAVADYRDLSGVRCIFVETEEDESGYMLRYWVDVDTGLLVAAEKLLEGESIYRMSSPEADLADLPVELFQLPDGKRP